MSITRAPGRPRRDRDAAEGLVAKRDDGRRLRRAGDAFRDDDDPRRRHPCRLRGHRAGLAEIATLPKGSWQNEMTVDGYDAPATLFATTTIRDDGIHVDYAGTGPASPRSRRCRRARGKTR